MIEFGVERVIPVALDVQFPEQATAIVQVFPVILNLADEVVGEEENPVQVGV